MANSTFQSAPSPPDCFSDQPYPVARLSDGPVAVIAISEVSGMEGDIISLQDPFLYSSAVAWMRMASARNLHASGIRPCSPERSRRLATACAQAI